MLARTIVHYGLHFLAPFVLAFLFVDWKAACPARRKEWRLALLALLSANLVDVDHLLATPVFDPNRCSVGSHLLHSYWMIGVYVLMALLPTRRLGISPFWRILGIGLLFHMAVDLQDFYAWKHPASVQQHCL